MNRVLRTIGTAALSATLLFAPVAVVLAHPSIDIVAANWKFTPATIELHVGETTTLRLTSSEGVHGIQSTELGIPQTMIMPGSFVTVSVTPKKAGAYVIHCSVICGAGHPNMVLDVNVVK